MGVWPRRHIKGMQRLCSLHAPLRFDRKPLACGGRKISETIRCRRRNPDPPARPLVEFAALLTICSVADCQHCDGNHIALNY